MQDRTNETMDTETASGSWTESIAASGNGVLKTVEDGIGTVSEETWKFFHDVPGHGAIIGGAVGLGAAMMVGVAELATAIFAGYVSYRVFAYGESWCEAVENAIKFEKGSIEKEELVKPILK